MFCLVMEIVQALRWVFSLERDEGTGGWRKLHNQKFHNLWLLFTNYY
jgi:hypothetical protein